jgi:hypothetical protein
LLQVFLALHEGLGLFMGVICTFTFVNECFSTFVGDVESPIVVLLKKVKVLRILLD